VVAQLSELSVMSEVAGAVDVVSFSLLWHLSSYLGLTASGEKTELGVTETSHDVKAPERPLYYKEKQPMANRTL